MKCGVLSWNADPGRCPIPAGHTATLRRVAPWSHFLAHVGGNHNEVFERCEQEPLNVNVERSAPEVPDAF